MTITEIAQFFAIEESKVTLKPESKYLCLERNGEKQLIEYTLIRHNGDHFERNSALFDSDIMFAIANNEKEMISFNCNAKDIAPFYELVSENNGEFYHYLEPESTFAGKKQFRAIPYAYSYNGSEFVKADLKKKPAELGNYEKIFDLAEKVTEQIEVMLDKINDLDPKSISFLQKVASRFEGSSADAKNVYDITKIREDGENFTLGVSKEGYANYSPATMKTGKKVDSFESINISPDFCIAVQNMSEKQRKAHIMSVMVHECTHLVDKCARFGREESKLEHDLMPLEFRAYAAQQALTMTYAENPDNEIIHGDLYGHSFAGATPENLEYVAGYVKKAMPFAEKYVKTTSSNISDSLDKKEQMPDYVIKASMERFEEYKNSLITAQEKNKIELAKGTSPIIERHDKNNKFKNWLKMPVKTVEGLLMLNAFRDTCSELKQDFPEEEVAAAILRTSSNPEIQTALYRGCSFIVDNKCGVVPPKKQFNTQLSEQIANSMKETIPYYTNSVSKEREFDIAAL